MNDPELETLLRHARATGPRPGSKERLRGRILAAASGGAVALATTQAGAAALTGAGAGAAGAAKGGSLALGIVACLAAGAAVGTAVTVPVMRSQAPQSRAVEPAASAVPRGHVTQAVSAQSVQPSPAPVASVAREPSALAPKSPGRAEQPAELAPSIQRETALLAQAQQAMQRGEFTLALVWLDRHQREFPGGALAEEALCARVIAACSLGQEAGRAAAKTFARLYPKSPLLPRVSSACANLDPR